MAAPSASPCIVWFRDDLRLSDHPALYAAAETGEPVICLYVFDEVSEALRAPASRPLGGAARWWLAQSLRALQDRLAALGASLRAAQGPGGQASSPNWRARPVPARCSGTRSRKRRIRRWPIGSPRRCKRSASLRNASPATSWRPRLRPHQGRPGLAGVHAVLAAGAGPGRSARAAAGAEDVASAAGPRRRHARKLGPRARRIRTGPAACAKLGRPARYQASSGSRNFLQQAWPATPAGATGPTATAHRGSPRTCALARSARGRSGTPPALPRPNALPCPATSTNS